MLNKYIEKLLNKLGYVPTRELEKKVELLKKKDDKYKVQEIEVRELQKECDSLIKEVRDISSQLQQIKKAKLDEKKLYNWARKVKDRDKKCVICGSEESLQAHHIWNKNHHPSIALDTEAGCTLCEMHHNEFHRLYNNNCNPTNFKKFFFKNNGQLNSNSPFILWRED